MVGTIKNLGPRGFGFITSDGRDYFFNAQACIVEPFDTLAVGVVVEFDIESSERGPRASYVIVRR